MPRELIVFADVRCPFTHVGLRRLVAERAARGSELLLRVLAWPLELVNDAPLDPHLIAEEVGELREQVAPELFSGFDVTRFPRSSLPALALVSAAYAEAPAAGERVSLLVRDACFEHGQDIADDAVLEGIAASAALRSCRGDEQAVLDEWADGRRRGVQGSPHFFLDDEDWFCPVLDITREDGDLRVSYDRQAFAEFVERCFG